VRRGLLYTERNARKVRIFAKGNVVDVWNQASSFYYGKRVANVFVGMREVEKPQYVQVVWEELVARDKDVTGSCLAIAGTRFPCFTLGG
jgi:hypothetical protein